MADAEDIPPLIFKIPNSGIEILCLAKDFGFGGTIYDPMKFADPIPWRSDCEHCREGRLRQMKMGSAVKRAVRLLCTRKVEGAKNTFRITNGYILEGTYEDEIWVINIFHEDSEMHHGTFNSVGLATVSSAMRNSPWVRRSLKFLLSGRIPEQREIDACLLPLRQHPPRFRKTKCAATRW